MGIFSNLMNPQQTTIQGSVLPVAARNEIMANRLPQLNTDTIFLQQGEICSYIDKAILNIKLKKRMSRHTGVSAPGLFKGHRVHTGMTKPIEYEELKQQKGILYITNKRLIFQAPENAFEKQHRYLSSIAPYSNAVVLQYGQKMFELIVPDGAVVNQVLQLVNRKRG